MADYWAEKMVVMGIGSRAGEMAVKAAVKMAGWFVVNWVDEIVGQMAACWDDMIVVTRVGLSAGEMTEKTAVQR